MSSMSFYNDFMHPRSIRTFLSLLLLIMIMINSYINLVCCCSSSSSSSSIQPSSQQLLQPLQDFERVRGRQQQQQPRLLCDYSITVMTSCHSSSTLPNINTPFSVELGIYDWRGIGPTFQLRYPAKNPCTFGTYSRVASCPPAGLCQLDIKGSGLAGWLVKYVRMTHVRRTPVVPPPPPKLLIFCVDGRARDAGISVNWCHRLNEGGRMNTTTTTTKSMRQYCTV